MPRCMINGVRGYKDGKYWGCEGDNQNVMMTRSGLLIRTVPAPRPGLNLQCAQEAKCQPLSNLNLQSQEQRESNSYKSRKTDHVKPMSCLSFVTRFGLVREGIPVNFAGSGRDIDHWAEETIDRNHKLLAPQDEEAPMFESSQGASDSGSDMSVIVDEEDEGIFLHPDFLQTQALLQPHPSDAERREAFNFDQKKILHMEKESTLNSGHNHDLNSPSDCSPCIENTRKVHIDYSENSKCTVILRCITQHEIAAAANAAATLVTMATGKPVVATSLGPVAPHQSACISGSTLGGQRQLQSQRTSRWYPGCASTGDPITVTDEEDDDSSSFTSLSSIDEASVKPDSEPDDTFQLDLDRFQMESHCYTTDANGNNIHGCTICDKVFTVFSAFKAHVNTHVRHKNRCPVCGKIFSRSWLLKGHMRTHTGERPYTCKHSGCDKKFADKSNLRSHMLIHTVTDKAYICSKCNRAFAQKRYLHKHKLEVCKI